MNKTNVSGMSKDDLHRLIMFYDDLAADCHHELDKMALRENSTRGKIRVFDFSNIPDCPEIEQESNVIYIGFGADDA